MDLNPVIEVPVGLTATGKFRAVVHTGHKYDQFGRIVEFGKVLRETPFGRNVITNTGFDKIFTNAATANPVMVCGTGNTTPNESNTTLAAYAGKTNTVASSTPTRNTTPDVDGNVTWGVINRYTFAPGSMGGGSVNVAEAGFTHGVAIGSVNASTPVSVRGLLVDGMGLPTTVSVNNAVEYLDIIHQYTEYVPASVTGTVTIDVDGVPTNYNYEVRPYYFDNTGGSFNFYGWQNPPAGGFPGWSPVGGGTYTSVAASNVFAGPLVAITGNGLGSGTAAWIPIFTSSTYVNGSKTRDLSCSWLATAGNVVGGIGVFRVNLGHWNWQMGYTPKVPKVNTKQLDMVFRLTMANRP